MPIRLNVRPLDFSRQLSVHLEKLSLFIQEAQRSSVTRSKLTLPVYSAEKKSFLLRALKSNCCRLAYLFLEPVAKLGLLQLDTKLRHPKLRIPPPQETPLLTSGGRGKSFVKLGPL